MKTRNTAPTILALVALLPVLESCRTRDHNEAPADVNDAPPSDTSRVVRCDLAPLDDAASTATFNGRPIRYFSSSEIPYETEDWWKKGSPWLSFDALDSTMLTHPGFPGTSRNFSTSAPVNSRVVAIDVRNINGTLKYHYFSNETATNPMENWSSTKSLAMLMAAHSVRRQTGKSFMSRMYNASSGGSSSGWIGDHVNEVARTSNNAVAVWLKSVTGGAQANNFAKNWLSPSAQFGGGHGSGPAALGNWVREDDKGDRKKLARAGIWTSAGDNTLTPIAMAEFWKRLAVNSGDARTWLKAVDYTDSVRDSAGRARDFFKPTKNFGLTDQDLQVLLYGFVNSTSLGGLQLGATSHDEFVAAFGGKAKLDSISGGKWRFFGKTGSGGATRSSGLARSESVFGGYVCIPKGSRGAPNGRLLAFFINTQAAGGAASARQVTMAGLANAMLPEVKGTKNLWGGSTTPATPPVTPTTPEAVPGKAMASVGTVIKSEKAFVDGKLVDSASLSDENKCSVAKDTALAYVDRAEVAGNHTKLRLKEKACSNLGLDVYVFTPHWSFADQD